MKVKVVMTKEMYDDMANRLFPPGNNSEQFGFIIAGLSQYDDGCNLLCRKFIPADQSCLINQTGVSVVPDPRFIQFIYNAVKDCKGCLVNIHTHPFASNSVSFSGIDDRSENESFPKEVEYLGNGPHVSMVLGRNSLDARWYNADTGLTSPVESIKVIGKDGIKIINPTSHRIAVDETVNDIHDRQVLAFGKAGQKIIQKQKVGIVGCGGLGSVLFIQLVRLGVKNFVLIDHDAVELSNLNRLAGSTLGDVKNKTPKVEMLGSYALKICPELKLDLINESVFTDKATSALKSCDYIFGGTDNESPRDLLNSISVQHMIPYIDSGTGIQATSDHNIEHAGGQVRTVIPGLGCLKCIKGIDLDVAQMERLPKKERQFVARQGYIAGENEHAPAVASLNGVMANHAVTEFMGYATGCKPLSRYVFYDFLKALTTPVEFDKNPDCFSCSEDTLLGSGDNGIILPEYLMTECSIKA